MRYLSSLACVLSSPLRFSRINIDVPVTSTVTDLLVDTTSISVVGVCVVALTVAFVTVSVVTVGSELLVDTTSISVVGVCVVALTVAFVIVSVVTASVVGSVVTTVPIH